MTQGKESIKRHSQQLCKDLGHSIAYACSPSLVLKPIRFVDVHCSSVCMCVFLASQRALQTSFVPPESCDISAL